MTAVGDFEALIDPYHEALDALINGDPDAYKALFSNGEDVTLANPFGGVARGRTEVEAMVEGAANNYRDGEIVGFETQAKLVTPELAYLVEVESFRAKVGGSDEFSPVGLRVTSVFRPEDGTWKVVHRHADPATGTQPAETVIQR